MNNKKCRFKRSPYAEGCDLMTKERKEKPVMIAALITLALAFVFFIFI